MNHLRKSLLMSLSHFLSTEPKEQTSNNEQKNKHKKQKKNRRVGSVSYKIKNKDLKDKGKEYVTKKGKVIAEKTIRENPCAPGKCPRGCYEITEEQRRTIFNLYWSLGVHRRSDFLIRCAKIGSIKRKRQKDSDKRKFTVDYYINVGKDHKQVCQQFLLSTLDVTQGHIQYTLRNAKEVFNKRRNTYRK
ncbi:uncharacterized protein LOC114362957 [Ostrinia furnacalis]|uniref:uncharacterized protein LOC114362957 n=1 Tax=Ostrinia furnacalis TaxID=93504 RepID=UPI0010401F53|nr:uncharacterized protein LOC114362957 [Ostrinia furnacalis]